MGSRQFEFDPDSLRGAKLVVAHSATRATYRLIHTAPTTTG